MKNEKNLPYPDDRREVIKQELKTRINRKVDEFGKTSEDDGVYRYKKTTLQAAKKDYRLKFEAKISKFFEKKKKYYKKSILELFF